MPSKTYRTTLLKDGSMCAIPVPFDPKPTFGKVRAPVRVTLNGYSYRSTIAAMGGPLFIPLRRSHREAAGLEGDETLKITIELDTGIRDVAPPPDLAKALKGAGVWERWAELSFTHRREDVESVTEAKKPETRQRRIDAAVAALDRKR